MLVFAVCLVFVSGSSITRAPLFWASLVKTYNKRLKEFAWEEDHTKCMYGGKHLH